MKRKFDLIPPLLFVFLFAPIFIVRAENSVRDARQQIRKEVIQEQKEQVKERTQTILERAKDIVKKNMKRQLKADLVSIAGNVLTVQKDQETYTINTTEKTQLKRKFGAEASLAEFSPKDKLLIIGKKVSEREIDATYIRNMSIQRRFIVFNGVVTKKSDNSITIKTVARGEQTVYVSSATTYMEKNKKISFSDIQIGNKVIVKGELWDRSTSKIDAKSILQFPAKQISPTPTSAAR